MAGKKLLVLASTYPRWENDPEPGFVHELCKRLTGEFEVRVICPHAKGAAIHECLEGVEVFRYRYAPLQFESLVNEGGIVANLKRAPWKWILVPFFFVQSYWQTWQQIRSWRPEIIHAHWLIPQGLVVALLGLIYRHTPPFVVTSHGADLYALRAPILVSLKRFVARSSAEISVVSRPMEDKLADIGINVEKVSVQPMGVDLTSRFTLGDKTKQRLSNEILFVGRLVEKKGLRHLIAALPRIVEKYPDAFLTVIGFGPEEYICRAQAIALEVAHKINFVGPVSQAELPHYYRRAAVFVAPFVKAKGGDQEGLGLVLVEALGCGCPVVVTDLLPVRDVVDGLRSVKLVPAVKMDHLYEPICEVLRENKISCRQGELQEQIDHLKLRFDWSNVARGYAETFKKILNKNALPS